MNGGARESPGSGDGPFGALKSALAWTAVAAAGLLLIQRFAGAAPGPGATWFWLELVSQDVARTIPFAAVAAGLRLAACRGRRIRAATVAGLVLGAAAFVMAGLVTPLLEYAGFVHGSRYGADIGMFGIQTPGGILRNLEYVRANPPAEYSLSVAHPDRAYPSRLEVAFHYPFVAAAVALLHTFVGLLLGKATLGMRSRARRLTRWSAALTATLALTMAVWVAQGPNRDWENVSGVVAAWTPVSVPVGTLLMLVLLAAGRRQAVAGPLAEREGKRYPLEDGRL